MPVHMRKSFIGRTAIAATLATGLAIAPALNGPHLAPVAHAHDSVIASQTLSHILSGITTLRLSLLQLPLPEYGSLLRTNNGTYDVWKAQEDELVAFLGLNQAKVETLEVVVPYQPHQAARGPDGDTLEVREWPWLKLKVVCAVRGVRGERRRRGQVGDGG